MSKVSKKAQPPKLQLTHAQKAIRKGLSSSKRYKRKNPDLYPFPVGSNELRLSGYSIAIVLFLIFVGGGFLSYANHRVNNPRYSFDRHRETAFRSLDVNISTELLPSLPSVDTVIQAPEALPFPTSALVVYSDDQRPVVDPNVHVIVVTATPQPMTFPPNWLTVTPVMHIDCTKYICTRIEYNFTPTPTPTVFEMPSMADRDAWFATFTPSPP